jgi:hypothetical protein
LALLLVGSFSTAYAADIRLGGGVVFDGTVPGGGLAIDIPMGDRPIALSLGAEYYKKSGVTTIYAPVMGLYKTEAGESAQIYLGAGSGIRYSASSTKALAAGVGGLNFKVGEKIGLFAEISYYRVFVSGADNTIVGKAGISFSLGE